MATIITLPNIVGLDKELCVPEGNQRLWNYFSVDIYNVKHSKIFKPHLFMPTNKSNLPYQKMVDRYQFLTSDGVKPQCAPLCQEGWYFDCETETCKEYSSYFVDINSLEGFITINRMWKHTTGQIAVSAKYNASNRMCINWLNGGGISNQILEPFWSEFGGGIWEGRTYSHNSTLADSFGFSIPNDNYINMVTAFVHDTHVYVLLEEFMQSGSDELFGSSFPLSYEVNNDAVIDVEVKITGKVYGVK